MKQLSANIQRSLQRLKLFSTVYCYAIAKLLLGINNYRLGWKGKRLIQRRKNLTSEGVNPDHVVMQEQRKTTPLP